MKNSSEILAIVNDLIFLLICLFIIPYVPEKRIHVLILLLCLIAISNLIVNCIKLSNKENENVEIKSQEFNIFISVLYLLMISYVLFILSLSDINYKISLIYLGLFALVISSLIINIKEM